MSLTIRLHRWSRLASAVTALSSLVACGEGAHSVGTPSPAGSGGASAGSAATPPGGANNPTAGAAATETAGSSNGGAITQGGTAPSNTGGAPTPVEGTGGFHDVGMGSADFAAPGQFRTTYYGKFFELPVGSVRALGWLKAWLGRQDNGLTGHPENLAYPYDTGLYAVGKIPNPAVSHGEDWWRYEQAGYFVDAVARMSRIVDAPNASKIAQANVSYLDTHASAGKMGESSNWWANTVVGRALMGAYGTSSEDASPRALNMCVSKASSVFYRDGFIAEEALYLYGLTGTAAFLDYAKKAYNSYFINDTASFSHQSKITGSSPLREHGVTAAEQLKLLPMMYSYTGDATALELAQRAFRKVESDSNMPDGGMVSSENLGTTAFNSLHETCDLTDWSWSMGYLLMASGDAHWADLIEKTMFNAVPGAVTKDFKQLQYFSSANQVAATNTICPRISPARMSYRAAHDTECCAGNVNRAMPNYVIRTWMGMQNGIAATLYGPTQVQLLLDGQPVTIVETTDYPFRDTISFTVNTPAAATFSLALRIPEWTSGASIRINGAAATVATEAGSFALLERTFNDKDVIELRLPMSVKLRDWLDGKAVSVERGPLVYALKVDSKRTESMTDPDSVKAKLKGNYIKGFPAVQFTPSSDWRYGIASAERAALQDFVVTEAPVAENPFDAATLPVTIQVPLHALPQWAAGFNANSASENPASLPTSGEMSSPGAAQSMTLVPYGSTYLRLTMLPVIP